MKFLRYTLIVLFSVGMMSCGSSSGDDVDNVAPGITITAPTESQSFAPGATINASFTATDNKALKSYIIDVTFVEALGMSVKIVHDPLTYEDSGDFSETPQTIPFTMSVPTDVKGGKYKITVKVADASSESKDAIEERIFIIE